MQLLKMDDEINERKLIKTEQKMCSVTIKCTSVRCIPNRNKWGSEFKKQKTCTVFLSSFSINLLCRSLIGYAQTHVLFCDRQ